MQCDKFRRADNKSRWKFAENHWLCFCCLLNHGKSNCLSKKPGGVNGCTHNHHQMLHKDEKQSGSIHNTNVPASQIILRVVLVQIMAATVINIHSLYVTKHLRLLLSMQSLLSNLLLMVQSCRSAVAE
jgi:hypothetical protein